MRHRQRGRHFGRTSSHRRAMLRNLASSLILTERPTDDLDPNPPKTKGRMITTLQKAKEVRPLVEKCITIACRALPHQRNAQQYHTSAARGTSEWRKWRQSSKWNEWNQAIAPAVAARRRALKLLGDKQAVKVLFEQVAPRFEGRPGGYTRVLRLAKPRLGDAGTRAIIEFVGQHDRIRQMRPERPAISPEDEGMEQPVGPATALGAGSAQAAPPDASSAPESRAADAEATKPSGDESNS